MKHDDLPAALASVLDRVFPLKDHALYGTAESLEDCQPLLPARLADFAATFADGAACNVTNLEICPACFFQSSGTTSRSKQIPYSDADLDRQKEHEALAFRKLGMSDKDGVLSLGAPLPSISGWAIVNGSRTLGAKVLNTCQLDYDDVVADPELAAAATVVIGTPLVVQEIGKEIAAQFGSVERVFPNMRLAILFGDLLPEPLRREIQVGWGFERVLGLYGTVEADVVATECPDATGEFEPMRERLILEIIPESELLREAREPGYQPRIVPLDAASDGTVGELLISDVWRDVLPILRYRIGDVVRVGRGRGPHNRVAPTLSVLGRSKNVAKLCGVPLYEMQVESAVRDVVGPSLSAWRLVQVAKPHSYRLLIAAPDLEHRELRQRIWRALCRERADLVPELPSSDQFDVELISQLESASLAGDAKARRFELMA